VLFYYPPLCCTQRSLFDPLESGEPDSTDQVSESGVAADWVEVWVRFEELQDIRLLLIGLLEPVESLFLVAKTQVRIHKRTCGNVADIFAPFQVR